MRKNGGDFGNGLCAGNDEIVAGVERNDDVVAVNDDDLCESLYEGEGRSDEGMFCWDDDASMGRGCPWRASRRKSSGPGPHGDPHLRQKERAEESLICFFFPPLLLEHFLQQQLQ